MGNKLTQDFNDLLKTYYKNQSKEIKQPSVHYFADILCVTPNYLSDTIRHHAGKSALTLIHEFVVAEAQKLLKSSDKTVSEIAFQLGFEYPNYFSKLFKRKTGVSPSEYRTSVKSI